MPFAHARRGRRSTGGKSPALQEAKVTVSFGDMTDEPDATDATDTTEKAEIINGVGTSGEATEGTEDPEAGTVDTEATTKEEESPVKQAADEATEADDNDNEKETESMEAEMEGDNTSVTPEDDSKEEAPGTPEPATGDGGHVEKMEEGGEVEQMEKGGEEASGYVDETGFREAPYPEAFEKLRELTVNIGPIKLEDLVSPDLQSLLETCYSFDVKFEAKEINEKLKNRRAKLGYVRIPFEFKHPTKLVIITDRLSNLKIGGRDMSVKFPQQFIDAMAQIKDYVEENRKRKLEYSQEQFKKRLILKKVPKTASVKKLQEQFPEAQRHIIKYQRDRSNLNDLVVRLEFETEEAAMEFYEKKKNDITIDDRKITVTYPYKDTMPQKKKPEKTGVPNNPAKSPASSAGTSRRNTGNTGHGGNTGPSGRGGRRGGRGGFNRNSGNTGNLGLTQQAAIRQQQMMLQQQQQQQLLAQQSNMGMGGMGMFGSGAMNQGQGLVSRNQSGMYGSGSGGYGSTGAMGGGYSGGQMGGQGGESDDDPSMIMASLKSTLAMMEQKLMSGGGGGGRKGGKRKGGGYDSYNRSDNKRQYGGASYGQNPNYY